MRGACFAFLQQMSSMTDPQPRPIPPSDPTLPVAHQLDAYNAKDIERFMEPWAGDCLYYAFPDTLLARGTAEIRARHVERFKEPDLFGRLISRTLVGNLVADHETVTRNFPEGKGEVDVLCLYEVADGKIVKAWFKMGEKRLLPG